MSAGHWTREATVTEVERLRTAFRITGSDEAEGHLSEHQWESLACGEFDHGDRETALDHILGCRRCTEIHQALLVLREQAHTFDSEAPVPDRPLRAHGRVSSRRWVFAGVLAVAATLVVVVLRPFGPGLTNPGTSATSSPMLRSSQWEQAATPLSPIGPISTSDVVFSWKPSPVAPVSIMQLIDDSGEVVWTSQETENTSVEWPSDVAKRPGRYYWRVLSLGGAIGGEQASDLVAFDLTGPSPANPP